MGALGQLLDAGWRASEMHAHAAMLVASAAPVLQAGGASVE